MTTGSYRFSTAQNRNRLVNGLGWFSIGLGLAELLAPRSVSRLIGVESHPTLMRLLGLREIATGLGLLSQVEPGTWAKARVAGDAMDLSLLGARLVSRNAAPGRLAAAAAAVAGVTALDVLCSKDFSEGPGTKRSARGNIRGVARVQKSVIVNKPAEELYRLWRDFEQLPRFMGHLVSVQKIDERRSHWVAKGPAGSQVEWDAEIINEHPNEMIAWRSLENADVDNAGSVRFEPATGGRGTIVRVEMEYRPPAGSTGAKLAKLLGEAPEKQIAVDLMRFRQWAETGEIARTEGQPAGRPRSTSRRYDELVRS
jgi:uncharacterized membrane protein